MSKMSDPKPSERVWFRHRQNGQLGYLIERDGKTKIRLDRASDPYAIRPYNPDEWLPMVTHTRVPRQAVAAIQWAADRALLRALGAHREAGRDWHGLTDAQRVEFMDKGPGKLHGEERRKVWEAIKEATRALVE